MKTPVEQAIEALEQGKLCANVAHNLGQHREDSESILGTVRRFDELRLAALASLKSMQPRLTVPQVMSIVGPLCIGDATAATILERLTQKAKP